MTPVLTTLNTELFLSKPGHSILFLLSLSCNARTHTHTQAHLALWNNFEEYWNDVGLERYKRMMRDYPYAPPSFKVLTHIFVHTKIKKTVQYDTLTHKTVL